MNAGVYSLVLSVVVLLPLSVHGQRENSSGVVTAPGNGSQGPSASGSGNGTGSGSGSESGSKSAPYKFNQSGGGAALLKGAEGPAPSLNGRTNTEPYQPTWTPQSKKTPEGRVFSATVGDFSRDSVDMIIEKEVFRIPRSRFAGQDLNPGDELKLRLTEDEINQFKRNKNIRSKLLDGFAAPSSKGK